MIIFLALLCIASSLFYGFGVKALLHAAIAVFTASILDLAAGYLKTRSLALPYSGIISGLFIGGLLAQDLKWWIYLLAAAIAVLSKHIIKIRGRHVFNPANFGILLASAIFGAPHSWWISSPIIPVILFGIFVIWKLKRLDLAVSFLASYFIISIILNFSIINSLNALFLFIANSGIILFFSMFMLIEPKTTPAAGKQRIAYGIIVAILLIAFGKAVPVHDLPLALAVGNIFGFWLRKK